MRRNAWRGTVTGRAWQVRCTGRLGEREKINHTEGMKKAELGLTEEGKGRELEMGDVLRGEEMQETQVWRDRQEGR